MCGFLLICLQGWKTDISVSREAGMETSDNLIVKRFGLRAHKALLGLADGIGSLCQWQIYTQTTGLPTTPASKNSQGGGTFSGPRAAWLLGWFNPAAGEHLLSEPHPRSLANMSPFPCEREFPVPSASLVAILQ